eukprot:287546_1
MKRKAEDSRDSEDAPFYSPKPKRHKGNYDSDPKASVSPLESRNNNKFKCRPTNIHIHSNKYSSLRRSPRLNKKQSFEINTNDIQSEDSNDSTQSESESQYSDDSTQSESEQCINQIETENIQSAPNNNENNSSSDDINPDEEDSSSDEDESSSDDSSDDDDATTTQTGQLLTPIEKIQILSDNDKFPICRKTCPFETKTWYAWMTERVCTESYGCEY